MTQTPKPSRKGIPLKPAAERKRAQIAFRVNDAFRQQLQDAADAAQRSVSEEVEHRLHLSASVAPILGAMASDKPTREFLTALAQTIGGIRKVSTRKNLSEVATRQALHAGVKHIAEVFFWDGETVNPYPEGYPGSMDQPPVGNADRPPELMGYGMANDAMTWENVWDRCALMEDYGDVLANYWSGDGSDRRPAGDGSVLDEPTGRSLDEIMAEVNPRDRAEAAKVRKSKPTAK